MKYLASGLLMLMLILSSPVMAAPVTLAFEAEVTNVFESSGATFNLAVQPGDKLLGQFTFEPFSLPPLDNPLQRQDVSVFQPYEASLQVDGGSFYTPVSSESLALTAIKNAIVNDGPSAQEDRIGVRGVLIPHDTTLWPSLTSAGLQIDLWGRQALLASAGIPGDIAVLNDFTFRRSLRLELVDTSGESVVVQGIVGDLSKIPEPPSLVIILLSVGSIGVLFRPVPLPSSILGATAGLSLVATPLLLDGVVVPSTTSPVCRKPAVGLSRTSQAIECC